MKNHIPIYFATCLITEFLCQCNFLWWNICSLSISCLINRTLPNSFSIFVSFSPAKKVGLLWLVHLNMWICAKKKPFNIPWEFLPRLNTDETDSNKCKAQIPQTQTHLSQWPQLVILSRICARILLHLFFFFYPCFNCSQVKHRPDRKTERIQSFFIFLAFCRLMC